MIFSIVLLIISIARPVTLWNLKKFNINDDYYVSNVAVYRNRAFLALPRDVCSNNISSPTAVEVPWMDDVNSPIYNLRKTIFPIEHQQWNKCDEMQNVVALNVEHKRARLWVLDKGNDICSAKILVYNLYLNSLLETCELNGINKENLNSLVTDSRLIDGEFNSLAYIGGFHDGSLLVFSLNDVKWWKVELKNADKKISSEFLALSKIDSTLFITGGNSLELFSLDVNKLSDKQVKSSNW